MKFPALVLVTGSAAMVLGADLQVHKFERKQLSNEFWSEGANFGDFNKDGENDIVSGPYWWAGPDFTKKHEYYAPTQKFKKKNEDGSEAEAHGYDPLGYSKNFFAFAHDINKDGWTDILILGFPGEESSWYENPKSKDGSGGHWKKHVAIDETNNESPTFGDLTGDGKPEIICSSKGTYGYATPESDPTKPWKWHAITPNNNYHKFTHGMGYGDVNGDGRADLLEKGGWWEQPKSLEGDPIWKFHAFEFSKPGGAQMYAYDVDGDGDNDVITSLEAHGYGLAWFEHVKDGENITFKQNLIIGKEASDNKYGVKFSQLHAVDLVDMDGDGLKDIVTGKRWWAHGPKGDAEPNAAAVSYWFKLTRGSGGKGGVEFTPYQMDDNSGIGTQVVAGNVNKDKLPDLVVGNKRGTFVLIHKAEKVSKADYEKAQPKAVGK
ncbi:MAG TPA: VCBS repeat-containing protein [Verrucomicrobiae bacterium]